MGFARRVAKGSASCSTALKWRYTSVRRRLFYPHSALTGGESPVTGSTFKFVCFFYKRTSQSAQAKLRHFLSSFAPNSVALTPLRAFRRRRRLLGHRFRLLWEDRDVTWSLATLAILTSTSWLSRGRRTFAASALSAARPCLGPSRRAT